jgi:tetratricopeptide (TPR) repeat protein
MSGGIVDYYDEDTLLDRLGPSLAGSGRRVIFVVGSALTAPASAGDPGVPNVAGVIDLIRKHFDGEQLNKFNDSIGGASNPYQEAFRFLLGRRSPQVANSVIKEAVSFSRKPAPQTPEGPVPYRLASETSDEVCKQFDNDPFGWNLTPAVRALGQLAVHRPDVFGEMIITTNFDPLIRASIGQEGGASFRTFLHGDGSLGQSVGDGTHIVHLHGYWYGSDTLHTPRQLIQPRPQLRASLCQVLRNSVVVVMGYGGWDDAFMQALTDVANEDTAYPEVIWTFYGEPPGLDAAPLNALIPGINRGRVTIYRGIDCQRVLPTLAQRWLACDPSPTPARVPTLAPTIQPAPPITVLGNRPRLAKGNAETFRRIAPEADSPPRADFFVGRNDDFDELITFDYRVAYITGIGGQGKSVLAAKLYQSQVATRDFDHRIWRDCREQTGRFEDHLLDILESLNDGRVSSAELARQPITTLAELFCDLTQEMKILLVLDNVDFYVDLERQRFLGPLGEFIDVFLQRTSAAKLILTCRPPVSHPSPHTFCKRLEGLDLDATRQLFRLRRAPSSDEAVARAHEITRGHSFWLDLLAAQVAKRSPDIELDDLLKSISTDTAEIPNATLRSIWNSLRAREQVVLQSLAETVRSPTLMELSDYLRRHTNYNQLVKAVNLLRDLNLIVLKVGDDGNESFELHPILRAFIRTTMTRSVRVPFIDAILDALSPIFGELRPQLDQKPSRDVIGRWLEAAELCVNGGRPEQALKHLDDVSNAVRRTLPPSEFIRITNALFSNYPILALHKLEHFESVFGTQNELLVNSGKIGEASDLLAQYRDSVVGKDARYIHYCDMQSYLHWMSGNYPTAIRWGTEGVNLKTKSGVDTIYSSAHNLALARRDSGAIDAALAYFLEGTDLDSVVDVEEYDPDRGGPFYGNIGRCLHLMGQIDPALICYRKSAAAIEVTSFAAHLENQAYIRQWIGELLHARGDVKGAQNFILAAFAKWVIVSPPKAERIEREFQKLFSHTGSLAALNQASAEQYVLSWIRTT